MDQPRSKEQAKETRQERPAAEPRLTTLLGDVGNLALSLARTYEARTRVARRGRLHFV